MKNLKSRAKKITCFSIYIMWNAIHFVLIGADRSEPIKNNHLSEAVIGYSEEFIDYTEKEKIVDIVSAFESFGIEKAMEKFSMKEC